MRHVEPKVYLIGKTDLLNEDAYHWLKDLGVDEEVAARLIDDGGEFSEPNEGEEPEDLVPHTPAEAIIQAAGRRCYMSFQPGLNPNVTKTRKDIGDYLENILKSGHGSVLEHVTYNFAIENVSRVFTGEMNRHRAGMAISEGSMRYIRFTDIPFWVPTSIRLTDEEKALLDKLASKRIVKSSLLEPTESNVDTISWALTDNELATEEKALGRLALQKLTTQMVFDDVFKVAEKSYSMLVEHTWKDELSESSKFHLKKELTSCLRRIIPMGVATGGIWTGNVRALRHICEMRCSEAAEEEINLVINQMLEILKGEEPHLFSDFHQVEGKKPGIMEPKYSKV